MRTPVMAVLFLASACGQPEDPTATASTGPAASVQTSASEPSPRSQATGPLSARLDCLRESGGVLLIGHRGGPTRDFPENALETLDRTLKAGTRAAEIDIAQTRDGKLVLMHDDDLDRTTTGKGLVSDHTLDEIAKLKLKTYSRTTDFHVPTLHEALAWAVENHAILELDKKKSASWDPIIGEVRAAKAETNVFLITYTDDQAIEAHQKAPDLTITATIESVAQLDALLARGVKADHLVAWTGTEKPDPDLWKALAARGIESAFGTLGPRSSSLDSKYWEDGNPGEYDDLVSGGASVLVTDLTDKVSRHLADSQRRASACGL